MASGFFDTDAAITCRQRQQERQKAASLVVRGKIEHLPNGGDHIVQDEGSAMLSQPDCRLPLNFGMFKRILRNALVRSSGGNDVR